MILRPSEHIVYIVQCSHITLHRGRHTKIFGWAKSLPPPLPFLPLYLFFPSPVSLHPLRSRLLK